MCIVHTVEFEYSEGQPGQEMKEDVDALLGDLVVGLELSRKLRALAEGPWRECDRSGRLPLRGILRECSDRIVTEARRCRRELEAGGKINFGSVRLEEGGDPDEPDPASVSRGSGLPLWASDLRSPAERALSGASQAQIVLSKKPEPPPLGPLRRVWAAILAKPVPGGPRWSAVEPRQGGT